MTPALDEMHLQHHQCWQSQKKLCCYSAYSTHPGMGETAIQHWWSSQPSEMLLVFNRIDMEGQVGYNSHQRKQWMHLKPNSRK